MELQIVLYTDVCNVFMVWIRKFGVYQRDFMEWICVLGVSKKTYNDISWSFVVVFLLPLVKMVKPDEEFFPVG